MHMQRTRDELLNLSAHAMGAVGAARLIYPSIARVLGATLLAVAVALLPGRSSAENQERWYRCNTHTHSNAFAKSDANADPAFIAEWYRTHGYQCVFITDHEHLTDLSAVNAKYAMTNDFLLIRGQEITQAISDPPGRPGLRAYHVNGLNVTKVNMPVGFPDKPKGVAPVDIYRQNFEAIRAAGGIPQVNHPNASWGVNAGDLLPLKDPFLIEVWNSFPAINNLEGTDRYGVYHPSVEALWDQLLSGGKIVWAAASDDVHDYYNFDKPDYPTPGHGWIVIRAKELTAPAIMQAIEKGSFYASNGIVIDEYTADEKKVSLKIGQSPGWLQPGASIPLRGDPAYSTRFIGMNGQVLATVVGNRPEYTFKGNETYVRASITDSNGRRGWTQPVFLDARKTRTK